MSVKRYYWDRKSDCDCEIIEQPDRAMVDYDEHASVVAELEARCTALAAELEARCTALAAENAGLKESRKNLAEFIHEELDAGYPLNMSIETPATNAFLAEVRVQGVERLANAWYAIANETDPGISISDSSRLKYRQRADDAADFANEIRQEAAQ